ncbi:MAG: peptide deformylase [Acidobacteria bacterium]|nr:peptide deformylase [Acidobacteriota bacterium]|tara:strand:+ start:3097 stop:3624 length:528 start_codon:yes stop_codon:yes gene_type:complete
MSILKVAQMGHPILRQQARPLDRSEIDSPRIQSLIDDMFETMHDSQGIGLAGPQVHESIRLFVAGVDDDDIEMSPVVIINPEITPVGSQVEEDWEGCLSIPGIRARVPRSTDIRVKALDRHGHAISLTASGFPARVIQHEADHLDGVLFFDRMKAFDSLTFLEEYSRYWAKAQNE